MSAEPEEPISVSVTRTCDLPAPSTNQVETAIRSAASVGGIDAASIHVVFTDDADIAGVHAEFFDDPSPTDVITFPIEGTGRLDSPVVGELLVSLETAGREASRQEHSDETESLLYVVHGVLHLAGFGDATDEERRKMRAAERVALQGLGLSVHYFD